MGWKDSEKDVFSGLKGRQQEWVRKRVNMDEDNDLLLKSREELIRMFPKRQKGGDEIEKLYDLNDAKCLLTFIWQAWLRIQAGEIEPVDGNERSFWYKDVEPFYIDKDLMDPGEGISLDSEVLMCALSLANLEDVQYFLEQSALQGDGSVTGMLSAADPATLGRVMRGARETYLGNKISWSLDEFVKRGIFRFQGAFKFRDPREDFRIIGEKRPRILFFTEKEGLWWLCEYVAEKHGISAVASRGEPGLLTMEYLYDDLRKAGVGAVEIGAVTDYDPWGWNIPFSFEEKMKLDIFFGAGKVKLTSLTKTQEDLMKFFTREELERGKRDLTKYSRFKQPQIDEWFGKTKGIDGKRYGIHIDLANRKKLKAEVDRWVKSVWGRD
jgi:hypothetical protein